MNRQICSECEKPIYIHGLSGNRLLTVCGCGSNQMPHSSYNSYPAMTIDPDDPTPVIMREISGEDLAWGNWGLAQEEIDDAEKFYGEI